MNHSFVGFKQQVILLARFLLDPCRMRLTEGLALSPQGYEYGEVWVIQYWSLLVFTANRFVLNSFGMRLWTSVCLSRRFMLF